MNTELIRGENMIVIAAGKIIGCARTCSLNTKVNIIGKSTKKSGSWKEFKGVSKEWSMSSDGLCKVQDSTNNTFIELTDLKNAMAAIVVGFTVQDIDGEQYNQYGLAIIVELNASGSVNNIGVYNVTLQGTGLLEQFPRPEIVEVVVTVDGENPMIGDAVVTFLPPIITPVSYTIEYGQGDTITETETGVTASPFTFEDKAIDDIQAISVWYRMKAVYADGESGYTEKIYPNDL